MRTNGGWWLRGSDRRCFHEKFFVPFVSSMKFGSVEIKPRNFPFTKCRWIVINRRTSQKGWNFCVPNVFANCAHLPKIITISNSTTFPSECEVAVERWPQIENNISTFDAMSNIDELIDGKIPFDSQHVIIAIKTEQIYRIFENKILPDALHCLLNTITYHNLCCRIFMQMLCIKSMFD